MERLTGPGGEVELISGEVLGTSMPVFRNRYTALHQVLAASVAEGERDYIVTGNERVSFAEHARQVASLAAALREEYGVGKGDRVAIDAANSPEWIVTFWATVSIGAIAVGFNAWWTAREVEYAVGHCTPKVAVADAKRAALLANHDLPLLRIDTDLPQLCASRPDADLPSCDVAEDDPAVLLYTSGTTGRPKGALHSHRNLLAVVEYHRFNDALGAAFGASGDPREKRYLLALPLFHIASLHNLAVPRLATGSTVVLHEGRFDATRVLGLIERERVTNWGAVPTQAHRLLEDGAPHDYDLSSLTAFALSSAPSSPTFKERLRKELPVLTQNLVDSYGLTECSTAATVANAQDLAESPGTLGSPILGVQIEIRDAEGNALPEGGVGEVCLRSAYNMLGYWQDEEATARAIDADRWLHTGDIGYLENGKLSLASRRSDLILRGGENVYPAEIENALAEHPAVVECVALGTPDADLGETVAAVVVTENPAELSETELSEFAGERLAHFKVPAHWRITAERLPRNVTGKIVRHQVEV